MYDWLVPIGYAVGGQLARAVLGMLKAWKEGEDISLKHFLSTLCVAGVLGFATSFVSADPNVLFLTGFSGTDALESVATLAKSK